MKKTAAKPKPGAVKKPPAKKKVAPRKAARPAATVVKRVVKAAKKLIKKVAPAAVTKKPVQHSKPATKRPAKIAVKARARAVAPARKTSAKKIGPKPASSSRSTLRQTVEGARKKSEKERVKMPLRGSGSAAARTAAARNAAAARRAGRREPAIVPPVAIAPVATPPKKARFKAEEMKKLRQALEQERERLVRDIRNLDDQALTDGMAETISQQPGFSLQLADSASDNQQVDTALGIRSIELDQLMQIDEALRMIQDGDYGICHRCGETISLERLLVKPMAKYCVPCRQLLESGKA